MLAAGLSPTSTAQACVTWAWLRSGAFSYTTSPPELSCSAAERISSEASSVQAPPLVHLTAPKVV